MIPPGAGWLLERMFHASPKDAPELSILTRAHPDEIDRCLTDLQAAELVEQQGVEWAITQKGRRAVAAMWAEERMRAAQRPAPIDPFPPPKRRRWWQRQPRPAEGSFEYWQQTRKR